MIFSTKSEISYHEQMWINRFYVGFNSITLPAEKTKFVCFVSSEKVYSFTPGNYVEIQLKPERMGVWCPE